MDNKFKIISKLFESSYKNVDHSVTEEDGLYKLYILSEIRTVYNPERFTPFNFFINNKNEKIDIGEDKYVWNLYDLFDNFIPQIKLEIYYKTYDGFKYIQRDHEVIPIAVSGSTYIY